MITYHSEIYDQSKHPFRMIANANIDKLMITFYHCPYSRTSTVLTRTNTCTGQKFDWTIPPASRRTLLLFFFPSPWVLKGLRWKIEVLCCVCLLIRCRKGVFLSAGWTLAMQRATGSVERRESCPIPLSSMGNRGTWDGGIATAAAKFSGCGSGLSPWSFKRQEHTQTHTHTLTHTRTHAYTRTHTVSLYLSLLFHSLLLSLSFSLSNTLSLCRSLSLCAFNLIYLSFSLRRAKGTSSNKSNSSGSSSAIRSRSSSSSS